MPPGAPLGLGGRWQTGVVRLEPGDTILMFSDGVVERRGRALADGLDALVAAAAGSTAAAGSANLCALATAAVPGTTDDDVAVLAVEHAVRPAGRPRCWSRPSRPARAGYASG